MPVSSAGVPNSLIVPLIAPAAMACLIAIAAPVLPVPNTEWPQPCPAITPARAVRSGEASCESPGSASYSARMPITGWPDPYVATNAVGMPATPASTVKPLALSRSCSSFDDFTSSSPVSAHPQMLRFTLLRVEALLSSHDDAVDLGSDWALG